MEGTVEYKAEARQWQAVTIHGQIPSKSNCYRIVTIRGHGSLAKSPALKRYEESFMMQCPLRNMRMDCRFRLTVDVYNQSDRADLDNSFKVLLDCLQSCKAIKNDRLCAEIHARKFIDKENPRITIKIEKLI